MTALNRCMFAHTVNFGGMEHSLFLRQFKYEIPRSSTAIAGLPAKRKPGQEMVQPALRVLFDFENECFLLEGDCGLIVTGNSCHRNSSLKDRNSRVFIDAKMKPEIPAGPNDNLHNELLLSLKGFVKNGKRQFKCSGLLSLGRNRNNNKEQWTIYCNLVDNDLDFFEVKLILPVYTSVAQSPGDN